MKVHMRVCIQFWQQREVRRAKSACGTWASECGPQTPSSRANWYGWNPRLQVMW